MYVLSEFYPRQQLKKFAPWQAGRVQQQFIPSSVALWPRTGPWLEQVVYMMTIFHAYHV